MDAHRIGRHSQRARRRGPEGAWNGRLVAVTFSGGRQKMASEDAPPGVFVRRAEFDDQPKIAALIGEDEDLLKKRFGDFDITNLMCARARCLSPAPRPPRGRGASLPEGARFLTRRRPRSYLAASMRPWASPPLTFRGK